MTFIVPLLFTFFGTGLLLSCFLCDRCKSFVMKILGRKRIVCLGTSSAIKGDIWYTYIMETPFGDKAYRYCSTYVGPLVINENGTGHYCGDFIWKSA